MDGTHALSRLTDHPILDSIAEPLSRVVRDSELAGPVEPGLPCIVSGQPSDQWPGDAKPTVS